MKMKMTGIKRIVLLLLFMSAITMMAQERFYPSRPRNDAALYEGPVVGVKLGGNLSRLYYTHPFLSDMPHGFMINKSFGIFLEIPFLRPCTVAPELNYQGRGGSFSYRFNAFTLQNDTLTIQHTYSLQANYISFRVPVNFYFPINDRVKPYLFVGPDFGMVVNGEVSSPQQANSLNYSNIKYPYFGALGGAGIRVNIPLSIITMVVKADAALNWGLTDTFSTYEQNGLASPSNVGAYQLQGKRYSRGLEVHLSIGFYFNKYDACSTFQ